MAKTKKTPRKPTETAPANQLSPEKASTPRRQIRCHQCDFATKYSRNFRRHAIRCHNITDTYICDKCDSTFSSFEARRQHKREVHPRLDSVKNCPICDYSTYFYTDLARHRNKHRIAQYHCRVCNYPFCYDTPLRSHMLKEHIEFWSENRLYKENAKNLIHFGTGIEKLHFSKNDIKKGALTIVRKREKEKQKLETSNGSHVNLRYSRHRPHIISSNHPSTDDNKQSKSNRPNAPIKSRVENTKQKMVLKQKAVIPANQPSENVFSCSICPYEISERESFTLHQRKHRFAKFCCEFCNMPFQFKVSCDKHTLRCNHKMRRDDKDDVHSAKTFRCVYCRYETRSFKFLRLHLDLHDSAPYNQKYDDTLKMKDRSPSPMSVGDVSNEITGAENEDNKENEVSSEYENLRKSYSYTMPSSSFNDSDTTSSDQCYSTSNDDKGSSDDDVSLEQSVSDKSAVLDKSSTDPVQSSSLTRIVMLNADLELSESSDTSSNEDEEEIDDKCATENETCSPSNVQQSDVADDTGHSSEHNMMDYATEGYCDNENATSYSEDNDSCSEDKGSENKGELDESGEVEEMQSDSTKDENEITYEIKDKSDEFDRWNSEDKETTNQTTLGREQGPDQVIIEPEKGEYRISEDDDPQFAGFEDLLGVLSKKTFEKRQKFYTKKKRNGSSYYICLICATNNCFKSNTELRYHFKVSHAELRRRICEACEFCSKPFPRKK